MQEGFEAERTRRQQDFEIESQKTRDDSNNMERTMAAKMEEGFRNEQQARQQAQKERMKGLKNEENARQMVQHDVQTIKSKKRSDSLGRATAVAAPFAVMPRRPWEQDQAELSLDHRQVLVIVQTNGSYQGRTNSKDGSQTTKGSQTPSFRISSETHKYRKNVDWDQTRTEQGTWPTKTMVNMWFSNEANLPSMIGLLDIIKEALKKDPYKLRGREVTSRLEMSPKRKPLARAHALFYKGLKEVKGSESKIHVVYGKIQISFIVGSAMAAKYTPEGEGLAGEGWAIKPDIISCICTEFSEALFETAVNSS